MTHQQLSARVLCDLDDVARLVPGYRPTDETQDLLVQLINAESMTAHRDTGREFMPVAGNPTRVFEITRSVARRRKVRIGDCATVTTVTILDVDQTTELETVTTADRVSLPRVRDSWEPVEQLEFPCGTGSPADLREGGLVQVTGTWGFPELPPDLTTAVAKMVLVRYLADVTTRGTSLAEALDQQGFNAGVAFAAAQATIRGFTAPFA